MPADLDAAWRQLVAEANLEPQLAALWGKSAERGGGQTNLLLQHLFDTMAVGGIIWDKFIASALRRRLDDVAEGEGRRLYVWLCGLHDVGKASPAFQRQVPELAQDVRAAGLTWPNRAARPGERWRHERASALILREILGDSWSAGREQLDWVWPMVAGHHGVFPDVSGVSITPRQQKFRPFLHGDETWVPVQKLLVEIVTQVAGWSDLAAACPRLVPSRADQLALSGLITMADWIASASDRHRFQGVDRLEQVSMADAVSRAASGWRSLELRNGWGELSEPPERLMERRFEKPARPAQQMVMDAALAIPHPGLMVIEAPMGEGKTEAAFAAAEILAYRFGADGVYIAMPTQATSDAMFDRVHSWLATFDEYLPLALLHGRRRLTDMARSRERSARRRDDSEDEDPYGLIGGPPSFASVCEDCGPEDEDPGHPAEWFFGRHRGLLTANGVGTIDQALYAGSRTKYVALRYAGLAGKVVVFDEVHAADVYMTQFLGEVLRWLGNGRVPVVLLSATLPPAQREHLVEAYLEGATVATRSAPAPVPHVVGYPSVLSASVDGQVHFDQRAVQPWRPSSQVDVSLCLEEPSSGVRPVVEQLQDRLAEGGCALVIRNTVARAQETFRDVAEVFGQDAVLLHSRFTHNARAALTERLLEALGPDGRLRPKRLVVVATQVAEQSFDVDADVLISDLAPIDLLLQRAGRVHRHSRPASSRPQPVRRPHIIVTGFHVGSGLPWFPPGSEAIYGRHRLLQSLALALNAVEEGGWSLPEDVPGLVAAAYGDSPVVPAAWMADEARASDAWAEEARRSATNAKKFLLSTVDQQFAPTLAGLHTWGGQEAESFVQVRDGEMAEEVVLVAQHADGWHTVDGTRLGPQGDAGRDRPEDVLGSGLRLPALNGALAAPVRELSPLPGWRDDPWLGSARALRLDEQGIAELGGYRLAYDPRLGLAVERTGR